MNAKRIVAVGRYNAKEEVVIVEPLFADTWNEGAADAVDAPQPEQSMATPYTMGQLDYVDGIYNPPRAAADHMEYIKGYNDEWAEQNGRTLLR